MNVEIGTEEKGIHKWDFRCSVLKIPVLYIISEQRYSLVKEVYS